MDEGLTCIEVESSSATAIFYISNRNMIKREKEMRETAKRTNVSKEQWSSSRIYSMWKKAKAQMTDDLPGISITLRLTPEDYMQDFSSFEWRPWLTTCIRDFYNTGSIRIQDQCMGSDLLLALEYLRIITTSPDIFVFNSFVPYERIKSWSYYFTRRRIIVDWVIQDYKKMGGGIRMYTTTPYAEEGNENGHVSLHVKGQAVNVMGATQGSSSSQLYLMIHKMFKETPSDDHLTQQVPSRIRHDFRDQLLRFLPQQTRISFETHRVTITNNAGKSDIEIRPVLRIEGVKLVVVKDERKPKASTLIENPPLPPTARKPTPNALQMNIQVPSSTAHKTSVANEQRSKYMNKQTLDSEYVDSKQMSTPQERALLAQSRRAAGPVDIVNTMQGDMQSVTSALSYSMVDETTIETIESTLDQMRHRSSAPSRRRSSREEDRGSESERHYMTSSEYESFRSYERRRRRRRTRGDVNVCETVESFFISVCDQMFDEYDNRAKSPVRQVTVPLGTDQETFHSRMSEDKAARHKAQENPLPITEAVEMLCGPPKDGQGGKQSDYPSVDYALNTAKKVGINVYNQVDEIVGDYFESKPRISSNRNTRFQNVRQGIPGSNNQGKGNLLDQNADGGVSI